MASPTLLVRARDEKGWFVGDDPSTPENEAWVPATETNDTSVPGDG